MRPLKKRVLAALKKELGKKHTHKWTAEDHTLLVHMWNAGLTCREISYFFNEFGVAVSDDAVAAIAYRLRRRGVAVAVRGAPPWARASNSEGRENHV